MSESTSQPRDPGDAKAWFYLDHRDDIEAWAALRVDARQLLDRHLVDLEAHVEELAHELQVDVIAQQLESGSWPRVGLRRPTWHDGGRATVGILIEWERAKLLTPASNQWPYVAVRMLHDDPGVSDQRQQHLDAMKPVRAQLGGQTARNFAYWAYVKATAPIDPTVLVDDCLARLRALWDLAAPAVDRLYSSGVSDEGSPQG